MTLVVIRWLNRLTTSLQTKIETILHLLQRQPNQMKPPISSSPILPRKSNYLFVVLAIFVFLVVLYSQNFSYTTFSDYYFISVVSTAAISGERIRSPPAKSSETDADPAAGDLRRFPPPASAGKLLADVASVPAKSAVYGSGESTDHADSPAASAGHRSFPPPASAGDGAEKKREKTKKLLPFAVGSAPEGCDIYSGRWMKDELTRPLYKESECPYIHPQLTCQEHGRPDRTYQQWRWQPHGCSLPAFNATMMLEALRGKRMLFVGDSLNRGQYASMVCLLQSVIPKGAKSMNASYDSLTVFTAKDYNATIEFYWAPFLLESNSDNAIKHRIKEKMVRKSMNKHGKFWKGADVVVFNTYLWWVTSLNMKVLKGSFSDKEQETVELKSEDAYRMAMKTMLKWVQKNMDLNKTRVFFTGMSPTHTRSIEWGGNPQGNCYNETTMIEDPTYWSSSASKTIMQVIGEEFSKSKVPISFLNITQLSNYRKDAHTSIHKKQWGPLTPEQLANPVSYADCIHWCLPGLQDTWNELLFAKLFYP